MGFRLGSTIPSATPFTNFPAKEKSTLVWVRPKQAHINYQWLKAGKENTKMFPVDVFTQRMDEFCFLPTIFIPGLNFSQSSTCSKT